MTVTDVRPLAGVSFEDVPQASPRVLPRMDVVGFVGFARTGPVHTPVVIESVADFERLFGADVELAWNDVRRRVVTSQLGTAVRDFFVNGGTRAWVVRAAGEKISTARVPLPGVLAVDKQGGLSGASMEAASPGAAGGEVGLACTLLIDRLEVIREADADPDTNAVAVAVAVAVVVTSQEGLVVGDLLRLRPSDEDHVEVVVEVVRVGPVVGRTPKDDSGRVTQRVHLSKEPLLSLRRVAELQRQSGPVELTDPTGGTVSAAGVLLAGAVDESLGHAAAVTMRVSRTGSRQLPAAGDWLRLPNWVSGTTAWVAVEQAEPVERGVEGNEVTYAVVVHGRVALPAAPDSWQLPDEPVVERLRLEVRADTGGRHRVLTDLGLLPSHPRFVGAVPDLATRLQLDPDEPSRWVGLDDLTGSPFPWSGDEPGPEARRLLPLLVDEAVPTWARAWPREGSVLEQDGLGELDARAFVDVLLTDNGVETIVGRAEELRWAGAVPHRVRGIHALLGVDEVTVVAVPDAAHVGWEIATRATGVVPPATGEPESSACDHGDFDDCEVTVVPLAPQWDDPVQMGDDLLLGWSVDADEEASGDRVFRLEESVDPTGWDDARVVHAGAEAHVFVPALSDVPRYFRVRAEVVGVAGAWSEGLGVAPSSGHDYVVSPAAEYTADVLLDVQRALLRMCAARGDLLAVLSVPEHYRAPAVAEHVTRLSTPESAPGPHNAVPPLGPWETSVLGYGALYHPWLVHGSGALSGPPDGAVAGVLAARARGRGAWVAPANERLHDVIALAHDETLASRQSLRARQANVVVRSRESFLWLSEDTLATDPDVRPVNVRRLHSLIRRVVLLEGPHYVFEPNDPVLRRGVERGFVELMRFLHSLGAFAGRSAAEAFRVSVGDVNPPTSIDAGRLVVEIAYAPSRPLEFLRVRLVHAGEPGFRLVES